MLHEIIFKHTTTTDYIIYKYIAIVDEAILGW